MSKETQKGIVYILLATLGFSIIPVLAKLGLQTGVSASTLLFYRFFIAYIFFATYLKIKKTPLTLEKGQLKVVTGAGMIYAVQCLCFFIAFNYIPASIGAILYNCYPIFVILLSKVFLNEKITVSKTIGVLTAIVGTVIVLYAKWEVPQVIGLTLVILTALVSGVYMVYNKKYTSSIDTTILTMYLCLVCSGCFLISSIVLREFVLLTELNLWINVGLLALWSTIIGLFGLMKAISLLNVGLVSMITLAEPIFTIILSFIILSERLTIQQIIGSIIVLLGIYFYENAISLPSRSRKSD